MGKFNVLDLIIGGTLIVGGVALAFKGFYDQIRSDFIETPVEERSLEEGFCIGQFKVKDINGDGLVDVVLERNLNNGRYFVSSYAPNMKEKVLDKYPLFIKGISEEMDDGLRNTLSEQLRYRPRKDMC